MEKFFLLLLFCHVSSAVKHSLKFLVTESSGVSNFSELMATGLVDDIQTGYCDTNTQILQIKQDWVKTYLEKDPQQLEWYTVQCFLSLPRFFKELSYGVMQQFNQSGGVHILQLMNGCEWDEETEEVTGFMQYGYDGEDFISLDPETWTWIALKPQAVAIKLRWDADGVLRQDNQNLFTQICPEWLKKYVNYGRSYLMRTDPPSVSLLQKTPSSPVSCHATGFYPDRAMMFWRKDGEELHEDVDRGEILPNHDGTFQMRADLNISSVSPEDWRSQMPAMSS